MAKTRRTFTEEEKKQILQEVALAPRGQAKAVYEKHGVYPAQLTGWRKQFGLSVGRGKKAPAPFMDAVEDEMVNGDGISVNE